MEINKLLKSGKSYISDLITGCNIYVSSVSDDICEKLFEVTLVT